MQQSPVILDLRLRKPRQGRLHGYRNAIVFENLRVDNVPRNISNTRDSVSPGYPNTEKRVENTTRSGVVLRNSRFLDA